MATTFGAVLLEELKLIRLRHRHLTPRESVPVEEIAAATAAAPPPLPGSPPAPPAAEVPFGPPGPVERKAYRQAQDMDLVGLALSGGGIRSATINLGVLQALAAIKLLNKFDYLSTVSGGGYIGSWLAAWIKRDGNPLNVEVQLAPSRVEQMAAKRRGVGANQIPEAEPEPVAHLRAYSNYLAPKVGLFAPDTWVLGVIYLRNFLVNQLILLPFVLFVLLVARAIVWAFPGNWQILDLPQLTPRLIGVMALGLLAVAQFADVYAIWVLREMRSKRPSCWARNLDWPLAFVLILLPLMVAAYLAAQLLAQSWPDPATWAWSPVPVKWIAAIADLLRPLTGESLASPLALGVVFAGLQLVIPVFFITVNVVRWLRNGAHWESRGARDTVYWLLASPLSGLVGGMLLWLLALLITTHFGADPAASASTVLLGPPLALAVFVLTNFVQTGLLSGALDEGMREWWASSCSGVAKCMVVWTALVAIVLCGPWLLLQTGPEIKALLGATWLTAAIAGVFAGRDSLIGSGRPGMALAVAAKLAPFIVILGLLVGVSWLAALMVNDPAPLESGMEWAQFWQGMTNIDMTKLFWGTLISLVVALVMAFAIRINSFSLHGTFRNRLVRCYLGASRPKNAARAGRLQGAPTNCPPPQRDPNPITGFDPKDDLDLHHLEIGRRDPLGRIYWGPLQLFNTALNLVEGDELAWQERKADAFVFTATHFGSRSTSYSSIDKTRHFTVGTAATISAAAVSPNMGYHSWQGLTALLAIFNVRLGRWLRNPGNAGRQLSSPRFALRYLFYELLGLTNAQRPFVYLSDGGHFDNLGVYELVRRRCRYILVSDAGADPAHTFDDLGSLIRKCRIDLGIRIEINVDALRLRAKEPFAKSDLLSTHGTSGAQMRLEGRQRYCLRHCAIGEIRYDDVDPTATRGILVYIKSSLTGDEPADVLQYADGHPTFPHQTTVDQFFNESQFESYRALGFHIANEIFGL